MTSRHGLTRERVLPIRDTLIEGLSHFVTSMTASIASGGSGCRWGLHPLQSGAFFTAHTKYGHGVYLGML